MKQPASKDDPEIPDIIWMSPQHQSSLTVVFIPQISDFWFGVRKWYMMAQTLSASTA